MSSIMLMWTPSILYDLLGGRYLMGEPSGNVRVLICSWTGFFLLVVNGLPEAVWAPDASHLLVSS